MKRKAIIILLLLVSYNDALYAQYTFQKVLSNPDDQEIYCVTEDDAGNFIMVGRKNSTELEITQAYLIRLSSSGELLNDMVLDSSNSSSNLFNVFFSMIVCFS